MVQHHYRAWLPRACSPGREKPPLREGHAPQLRVAPTGPGWRKPARSNAGPVQPKMKMNNKIIKRILMGISLAGQGLGPHAPTAWGARGSWGLR